MGIPAQEIQHPAVAIANILPLRICLPIGHNDSKFGFIIAKKPRVFRIIRFVPVLPCAIFFQSGVFPCNLFVIRLLHQTVKLIDGIPFPIFKYGAFAPFAEDIGDAVRLIWIFHRGLGHGGQNRMACLVLRHRRRGHFRLFRQRVLLAHFISRSLCFCGQIPVVLHQRGNAFRGMFPCEVDIRTAVFSIVNPFPVMIFPTVGRSGQRVGASANAIFLPQEVLLLFLRMFLPEEGIDTVFPACGVSAARKGSINFIVCDKPADLRDFCHSRSESPAGQG